MQLFHLSPYYFGQTNKKHFFRKLYKVKKKYSKFFRNVYSVTTLQRVNNYRAVALGYSILHDERLEFDQFVFVLNVLMTIFIIQVKTVFWQLDYLSSLSLSIFSLILYLFLGFSFLVHWPAKRIEKALFSIMSCLSTELLEA